MTLFVPDSAPGFVSLEDGEISLHRILIPVDQTPDPRPALVYLHRHMLGENGGAPYVVSHGFLPLYIHASIELAA